MVIPLQHRVNNKNVLDYRLHGKIRCGWDELYCAVCARYLSSDGCCPTLLCFVEESDLESCCANIYYRYIWKHPDRQPFLEGFRISSIEDDTKEDIHERMRGMGKRQIEACCSCLKTRSKNLALAPFFTARQCEPNRLKIVHVHDVWRSARL